MPLQGIRGCGVENPQGFGLDERGFVIAYLRLFAFICGFLDSNTKTFYTRKGSIIFIHGIFLKSFAFSV